MRNKQSKAEVAPVRAGSKNRCPECQQWREAIVDLINWLPGGTRSLVCAKLATMPKTWAKLTPKDKLQAKLVLASEQQDQDLTDAAPAMLEALRGLVEWSSYMGGFESKQWDTARAAIALAGGGK